MLNPQTVLNVRYLHAFGGDYWGDVPHGNGIGNGADGEFGIHHYGLPDLHNQIAGPLLEAWMLHQQHIGPRWNLAEIIVTIRGTDVVSGNVSSLIRQPCLTSLHHGAGRVHDGTFYHA